MCACCISAYDKGNTILCFLSFSPCIRRRCPFGAVYVALEIKLKYKPISSQLYTSSGSCSSRIFFDILNPFFDFFRVYITCFPM